MAAVLNTKESESNLHQSPVSSVLLINYQQSPGTGSSGLTAQGGFLPLLCFFASPWAAVISGYRTGQQDEHSGTLREAVWNLFYEAHGKGRGRARQG